MTCMAAWVGRVSIVLLAALAGIFATNLVLESVSGSAAGTWPALGAAVGMGACASVVTARQHPLIRAANLGAGWGGAAGFFCALIHPVMRDSENSLAAIIVLPGFWLAGVLLGAVLGTAIAAVRLR